MPPARQLTSSANIKGKEKSHRLLVPGDRSRSAAADVCSVMNTEAEQSGDIVEEQTPQPAQREITIVNPLGLHARPAAEFVRCAARFRSEIHLVKGGYRFSAASIME